MNTDIESNRLCCPFYFHPCSLLKCRHKPVGIRVVEGRLRALRGFVVQNSRSKLPPVSYRQLRLPDGLAAGRVARMGDSPRKRFLSIWQWLALVVFVLLLLGVGLHAAWTAGARAKLDREVAALIAAGEPMRAQDFSETFISDDGNLVTLIREAKALEVGSADWNEREQELRDEDPHAFRQPLTGPEAALLREQVEANAAALKLLAAADAMRGAFWDDLPDAMRAFVFSSDPAAVRAMANLLADNARLAAHDRRSADVIANLYDLDAVGSAMRGRPGLIGALIKSGVDSLIANIASQSAARLEIGEAPAASSDDVRRLIAKLMDDGAVLENVRSGLRTERFMMHDVLAATTQSPVAGSPVRWNPLVRYVMAPIVHTSDAAVLDLFNEMLRIADRPSLKAYREVSTALAAKKAEIDASKLTLLASILAPSTERYMEVGYKARTQRHLAAAALAVRLYATDHDGAMPPSLDALVPGYLSAVPADAMDGAPLRYDPSRAIVWSVGTDLTDNGGDASPTRTNSVYDEWQARDVVVYLTPLDRPAPPADAAKAVDHPPVADDPFAAPPGVTQP